MTNLPHRSIHIFGDESSHRGNHKYLVYGTMSCEREKLSKILAKLDEARRGREVSEWKWSGNHHRDLYPGFVDAIFKCRTDYGLRYRCLVVNTRHTRHAEYNNNDPDLGLEKYIFLHLLDYARKLQDDARFYVLLDQRTKKYTGAAQKRALNGRDQEEHGRPYELFREVLDVDSKSSRLVQAADVISGAVAWVMNERYLAEDASPKKRELAEHVAKRARIPSVGPAKRLGIERGTLLSLSVETPPYVIDECGFASWHLHLRSEEEAKVRALSEDHLSHFPADTTFAELAEKGFAIVLECPRCDRRHPDYLSAKPAFGQRRIKDRRRMPPCSKCGRGGVVLLRPAPRDESN